MSQHDRESQQHCHSEIRWDGHFHPRPERFFSFQFLLQDWKGVLGACEGIQVLLPQ